MTPADPIVLVIEDEPKMRDLLLRAISSWGFDTLAARSAEEALRIMDSQPAHIVLLDLNLPCMAGMECFEHIRQRWPAAQVIILTGFGDLDAAKQAIHLDVVEFLTKPCHLGQLEVALGRAKLRLIQAHQPPGQSPAPAGVCSSPAATLDAIERQHILATLVRNNGNRAATAQELGISLRTLFYRLAEYQKQGYSAE